MKGQLAEAAMILGLILIAVGIVWPMVTMDITSDVFRYVFSAGAVLLFVSKLISPYDGDNLRVKRLYRIEMWGALFFCVAAFLMFYDTHNMRDPIAFVLAGGIIQIYTSIMIPRAIKKAQK